MTDEQRQPFKPRTYASPKDPIGVMTMVGLSHEGNGYSADPLRGKAPLRANHFVGPAPTVSLVIPVRNEARNIAWVLEQIADDVHEIIIVDGNSTDVTLITARNYRPDIKVVSQEGIGKGSALRTGFQTATGDVIVTMDADGSMSPREIGHFLYFLNNGYDFVKGSRFMGGGGSLDITRFRRLGNRFLLAVFNTLYGGDLTDLCYGFCAFHRRYLDHLALTATGFEIEAEMTVRAMQAGLRIAEVPSLEMPRRAGKSNLHAVRDGWRVLNTVVAGRRREPPRSRQPATLRPTAGPGPVRAALAAPLDEQRDLMHDAITS